MTSGISRATRAKRGAGRWLRIRSALMRRGGRASTDAPGGRLVFRRDSRTPHYGAGPRARGNARRAHAGDAARAPAAAQRSRRISRCASSSGGAQPEATMADTQGTHAADVLIVGAGPVGLTAALELTPPRRALPHHRQAAARTDKSKALVLWSRTLELLDDIGGAAPFLAAGIAVHGAQHHRDGKRARARRPSTTADSPYPFALMIPQSETERLLEEHLAALGRARRARVELLDLSPRRDAVTATLRHRRRPRGDACAAPGSSAATARTAPCATRSASTFAGAAEPNDWILADVHIDGPLAADEIEHLLARRGRAGALPDHARALPRRSPTSAWRAAATGRRDRRSAEVQAMLDERGPGGLGDARPDLAGRLPHQRAQGRRLPARPRVPRRRRGPHPQPGRRPGHEHRHAGRAQSRLEAGPGRARHAPRESLLDSYSGERSAVGDQVLRNAGAMTRMATLRNPTAQHLRRRLLPLLASLEFVQRRFKATMAELRSSTARARCALSTVARRRMRGCSAAGSRRVPRARRRGDRRHRAARRARCSPRWTAAARPAVVHRRHRARRAGRDLVAIGHEITQRFGDTISPVLVVAADALPKGDPPALARPAGSGARAASPLRRGDGVALPDSSGRLRRLPQPACRGAAPARASRWLSIPLGSTS